MANLACLVNGHIICWSQGGCLFHKRNEVKYEAENGIRFTYIRSHCEQCGERIYGYE